MKWTQVPSLFLPLGGALLSDAVLYGSTPGLFVNSLDKCVSLREAQSRLHSGCGTGGLGPHNCLSDISRADVAEFEASEFGG